MFFLPMSCDATDLNPWPFLALDWKKVNPTLFCVFHIFCPCISFYFNDDFVKQRKWQSTEFSSVQWRAYFFSSLFKKKIFFGVPHLATCIVVFFYNEPELDAGINPGMALTPLPSSIGRVSNPQPSNREPSIKCSVSRPQLSLF